MTIALKTAPAETVMIPQAVALGRVYAIALADFAAEAGDLREIAEELRGIAQLVRETPGCREFMALAGAAVMNRQRCESMVERIFAGRVSKPVEMLLGVLAANGRLGLIEAVSQQFGKILDQRAGRIDVSVATAVELDDQQREQLQRVLTQALRAEPILHTAVDAELIGGLVVKVGDTVYDGSVAGDLARLTEAMKKNRTRISSN